jgi:hypothetical protein
MARYRGGPRPIPAPPIPQSVADLEAQIRAETAARRAAESAAAAERLERIRDIRDIALRRKEERLRQARESTRFRWAYNCQWIDADTGEIRGETRHTFTTESGTNYQQASRMAREMAAGEIPTCVSRQIAGGANLTLRCRRSEAPIRLP